MPHIIVRGVPVEQMCLISKTLVEDLAVVCECGTDNFMIECIHTTSVFDGEIVESYPFIEVAWFERGQSIRDRVAQTITMHVRSLGIPEVEIAFIAYREDSYYINGERCDNG
ncbi:MULTISPECIES: DUF1904 family protein [unclassified Paenibacillus]|uniref:DUF1904 family protein n=1 Tax=unclassified Paenibacillus TaxID=185978 RepID=UPI001AEB3185|nr:MULTISPECIES: DUF1904 family protein [unclassified Paenibacillus]MBP1157400.1 hypothetical protein [Paenibacillus sp. PvP091]MBP1171862.1 hypothetical protein [Paenibacillus sp. PvR098]MBP2438243.1 hypothetical protein [Paenibacillus sp. PvP052]